MKRSIVLIHGAWLSPRSWENFETYFKEKGYEVFVPEWPRKADGVEAQRRDPSAIAGVGIKEIVDHLEGYVRQIPEPPVIVGHSFGGLFAMMLLDRGLGAAGVAIDPAPPKGIFNLPAAQLRAAAAGRRARAAAARGPRGGGGGPARGAPKTSPLRFGKHVHAGGRA